MKKKRNKERKVAEDMKQNTHKHDYKRGDGADKGGGDYLA